MHEAAMSYWIALDGWASGKKEGQHTSNLADWNINTGGCDNGKKLLVAAHELLSPCLTGPTQCMATQTERTLMGLLVVQCMCSVTAHRILIFNKRLPSTVYRWTALERCILSNMGLIKDECWVVIFLCKSLPVKRAKKAKEEKDNWSNWKGAAS